MLLLKTTYNIYLMLRTDKNYNNKFGIQYKLMSILYFLKLIQYIIDYI